MSTPVSGTDGLFEISRWISERTLAGEPETRILEGTCERLAGLGVGLRRVLFGADTLHPVLEGRFFEWRRDRESVKQSEYGRTEPGKSHDLWLQSPFHQLLQSGESRLRRRIGPETNAPAEFPILADLAAEGITDYIAYCSRLEGSAVIGQMDCIFSSFTTDRPSGFGDAEIEIIDRIVPCLASAILGISLGRIADTLVETYLGRDAGRRVLRGSIERGVAERIQAVLWFSDLKGFTRIVDTVSPELVIPMLNDYADAIASSIHDHDGQVLKLVGDGVLATFALEESAQACRGTLDCVMEALRRIEAVNDARTAKGLPTTGCYIALHVGDVFYGNIGSTDRLDFTVIGPAVNELTRMAAMSRTLDQDIILSSAFADAAGPARDDLVSLGRYALRGVSRPQELFTLDRERYRSRRI
ncbi:MAG: adenylate/guanylate cyclase domain-containing protein [Dongiaceae bacterium]